MKTEQVYLSHNQAEAVEMAINELRNDGITNETIEVVNNGPGRGSWMNVAPTNAQYLFFLGLKAGKYLH